MSINENDFRGVDLNLLVVFHALMRERNVTRAAQRLFVGQPALSASLKRLRAIFDDELFVRTARGMVPTARATELATVVLPMLETLQGALGGHAGFDPAAARRIFRVGLSDSLEVALMPWLLRHIAREAPGVRIVTRAADSRSALGRLDSAEVELAVGVLPASSAAHRRAALFEWHFVCLFDPRQVRIRGSRVTLAEYLRHPHVLTSFEGGLRGFIDERLEDMGHERRVIFSSPHFATSPLIVRQVAALTTVPTFIAQTWCAVLPLSLSPLPFDVPSHRVDIAWSAADDADAGLRWLIEAVRAVAAEAFGPASARASRKRARAA